MEKIHGSTLVIDITKCKEERQLKVASSKVPKCEIFDRSDFPDFYTIKSRQEGDFGVKIKNF